MTTTTTTTTATTCPKCFGSKVFTRFTHIVGGTCFRCGGTGVTVETDRSRAARPTRAFIPNLATPYAVVCTDADSIAEGSGGRIGGNKSWDEACALIDRLTAFHCVSYEVVKYVDGKWINKAGTEQNI